MVLSRDHGGHIFASEQYPEVELAMGSGVVSPITKQKANSGRVVHQLKPEHPALLG